MEFPGVALHVRGSYADRAVVTAANTEIRSGSTGQRGLVSTGEHAASRKVIM